MFEKVHYKTDEEGNVFCNNVEELAEFATDGMWESVEDLEADTGVGREEMIGKWFIIVHGRVYHE